MTTTKRVASAFYFLIVLFFLWGFLTSLNDILVPHLKAAFALKHWQAQLIQFFFFGAYFAMGYPAGLLIKRVGYQRGIVLGLGLMGLGCGLFYPASVVISYPFFLLALFVLASGITILQVAANPYVAIVGPPESAASRLNLAQGFNSIGHTIAPLFGAWLILENKEVVSVETVQMPYIGLAIALISVGLVFNFLKLPMIDEVHDPNKKAFRMWDHPHLVLGALAIFCYVGAEITVGSFLVEYLKLDTVMSMDNKTAGSYVAFYWGSAMIGRFMGGFYLSKGMSQTQRIGLMAAVPVIAFVVVWMVVQAQELDTSIPYYFLGLMLLNFGAFFLGKGLPSRLLAVFAMGCLTLLAVSVFSTGVVSMWTMIGIGLFNSIMWSNIFTLAIEDLGEFTSNGSSLLVMMIVGGAIIPVLQGLVVEIPGVGVKQSFVVTALAYGYLIYYGLIGYKKGRNLAS